MRYAMPCRWRYGPCYVIVQDHAHIPAYDMLLDVMHTRETVQCGRRCAVDCCRILDMCRAL
eukprot:7913183-Pyramimonas_sp.AAC.1